MSVPPISSGHHHFNQPSLASELKQLWDNWWNDPSRKTGEALLHFLEKNKKALTALGDSKKCPLPFPDKNFSDYLNNAINYLSTWIDHGCNPNQKTPVSEWLNDIYQWIK